MYNSMNQSKMFHNLKDTKSFHDRILSVLSFYDEKTIEKDKNVKITPKKTEYFLNNDSWNTYELPFTWVQLELENYPYDFPRNQISFNFNNKNVKLEMKYIVYNKLSSMSWSLNSISVMAGVINNFALFINSCYPDIQSICDINLEDGNKKLAKFLKTNEIATHKEKFHKELQKTTIVATKDLLFLNYVYEQLSDTLDNREEWLKDTWDIRNLPATIKHTRHDGHYLCRFGNIVNVSYRELLKHYFKKRLLGNNKFTFGSCMQYCLSITVFLNFIAELYPEWQDFKLLTSSDMEAYVKYLNELAIAKSSKPLSYMRQNLVIVRTFLEDIQIYEWKEAPKKHVQSILHDDFIPSVPRNNNSTIKYIPDSVLEQLVSNFQYLPKEVKMIVMIMMQTGLRISDTLELKYDCLIKRNGNYSIVTDIQKTSIQGHEIPLVGDIIPVLERYAKDVREKSTPINNPDRLLFNKFEGKNKGKAPSTRGISGNLNILAIERNIVDENGEIYHFRNHAFRHTFAVKMINNNMCLVLLQDVLGHASADMTLSYAKLVDDTKHEEFKKLYEKGVFKYSDNGLEEVDFEEKLKEINWNWEWVHHKMNAINTPYGTCLQRANGSCSYAKQPPCLTCQGGKPCKHLLILADDAPKYKVHIESTQQLIQQAEIHNRPDWLGENQEMLSLYEEIFNQIKDGNLIFGNIKHLGNALAEVEKEDSNVRRL